MSQYTRLSFVEREEISRQLASSLSIRSIAKALNRSPSTLLREIKRTSKSSKTYRAIKAQRYAKRMKHITKKQPKMNINPRLRSFVFEHLNNRWTPEQIANRLKFVYPNDMLMRISHESIYSYLYVLPRSTLKKQIIKCLRREHKNRRKHKDRQKCSPIQDYLSIEERPKEVADQIIPGHWEGDLIMGHKNESAIGTLVERTTYMTFIVHLKAKDSTSVREAFAKEFLQVPKKLKLTLTYDQGQEMAQHKLFTKDTNITVYFAHPHSPWERGINENTNALIRQFFPKGTDFNATSFARIKEVQDLLNDRPRKKLNWYTPHEAFSELLH